MTYTFDRYVLAFGILVAGFAFTSLVSCSSTGQLTPASQTAVTIACAIDAAAPAAVAAGQAIATISGADAADVAKAGQADAAVHPLAVQACQALLAGSKPVPGTMTVTGPPASP